MNKPRGETSVPLVERLAQKLPVVTIPILTVSLGASAFALLSSHRTPLQQHPPSARVISEGLRVQLDRSSPAYAALEDAWTDVPATPPVEEREQKKAEALTFKTVTLAANTGSIVPVLAGIVRDNRREVTLAAQERYERELRAQAFARAAVEVLQAVVGKFKLVEPVAAQRAPQPAPTPEALREKLPTTTISLAALHMTREQLLGTIFYPMVNANDHGRIPTASAKARASVAAGIQMPPAPRASRVARDVSAMPAVSSARTSHSISAAMMAQPETPPSANVPPARQVTISGQIEFMNGLAMSNTSDRIIVYHEKDGEPAEAGEVWLQEGRFKIFIDNSEGSLIGELRTPYGDILGRAEIDLAGVAMDQAAHAAATTLRLKPVAQGVVGTVVIHRSNGDRVPVKAAQVLFKDLPFAATSGNDGRFEQSDLLEGSTVITKTIRRNYWGTLAFSRAGTENEIEMYADRPGEPVHDLVANAAGSPDPHAAVVWGRVTVGGKPVAGAHVDILTTARLIKPTYFNMSMLPDPSLTETSANGLYAFYPVPAGAHAVQATLDSQVSEPLIFPAEERTVSRMDIETGAPRQAKMKVFDAFNTYRPLAVAISAPGSATVFAVPGTGEADYRYAPGKGVVIVDADAGNGYQRTRINLDRDRPSIFVPMLQTSWLENIVGSMRVNFEPYTGGVVGFIQGTQPYKVILDRRSLMQNTRLVYFDNRGQTTGLDYGVPGGGFVIFNVPEGFRTITVQPSGSGKAYASVVLVDAKVDCVLSHWIR